MSENVVKFPRQNIWCFVFVCGFALVSLTYLYLTLHWTRSNAIIKIEEYSDRVGVQHSTTPHATTYSQSIQVSNTAEHVNITVVKTTVTTVRNPHPFRFTIANEHSCSGNNSNVFLVILVKCRIAERFDREQIRRTWGGVQDVLGRRIRTMFLLGQPHDPSKQKLVEDEDKKYHDLVQENFRDTYYNLTYKNLMGWKWLSTYCPNSSYGLSIDSDMALNTRNLVQRLETMPTTNFAEGNLRTGVTPMRNKVSKWYIPKELYSNKTYPPFLNGGCYAVSTDVAGRVFETSARVPFFKLDDVYIGMVLDEIKLKIKRSGLYQQYGGMESCLRRGIAVVTNHVKSINRQYLTVWHKVVGSLLENDKKSKTKEKNEEKTGEQNG